MQKFFVLQQFKEYGRFQSLYLTRVVLNLLKNKFEKSVNISNCVYLTCVSKDIPFTAHTLYKFCLVDIMLL